MRRVEVNKWAKYFEARNVGVGIDAAAKKARLASSTCHRFERGDQTSTGLEAAAILGVTHVGDNIVAQKLTDDALVALKDFAYFRLRYFGRKSTPWQERSAYEMARLLETNDREYAVVNMPPGAGKSTLFTHDIPCWLVARSRGIRILIGARTERQARMYVGRIKKSLERDAPLRAPSDLLDAGIAHDAVGVLQDDFGAFKPEGRSDLWRAESLAVRQLDGVSIDDKEPTVSAYGQDSGFLGGRYDLAIWDDLVDSKNTRSGDAQTKLREWWATEAETRLEPGGVLLLQGQRIGPTDLYRYALDMKDLDENPKYRHLVYPAHDEKLCTQEHDETAKPWPHGCLLDPHRLPHRMLETVRRNDPRVYDIQYQQNDGSYIAGLVQKAWITGGTDLDGYLAPGCLDLDRSLLTVPEHLPGLDHYSFVTVDPSPTQWWGVIWWIYDPMSNNRYIIDLKRERWNPEDFLSINLDTLEFSGWLHNLRQTAIAERVPIQNVIVETNAAQKWLLTQPHIRRWILHTGIQLLPHTTHVNKSDPQYGFESTGDLYRQGKIRIPYLGPKTRMVVNDLLTEAYNYPDGDTDDLLMSIWFGKLAVEKWVPPTRREIPREGGVYNPRAQRGLSRYAG